MSATSITPWAAFHLCVLALIKWTHGTHTQTRSHTFRHTRPSKDTHACLHNRWRTWYAYMQTCNVEMSKQTTCTHKIQNAYLNTHSHFNIPKPRRPDRLYPIPDQTHYSLSVFVFVCNLTQSLWLVMGWLTHKDEIHANPNNLFTLMLLFKHGGPIRFPPAISTAHQSTTTHYM